MTNIAIFASGSGTNAENIIKHFLKSSIAQVNIVFCNVADAYVLTRANKLGVPTEVFSRQDLYNSDKIIDRLKRENIDFIVLAGFLWLVPNNIIQLYSNKIVNIHPALLPAYGGRGMFGMNVHRAVIAAGERKSGITIHYVNEKYDEGNIIFQAHCDINENDTPETLAEKIHELEQKHFPNVIEEVLRKT